MSVPHLSPDASSVNVSNSLLRFFGVPQFHKSFAPLDNILDSNTGRKLCFILFDGFGKYIQRKARRYCPFVWDHRRFDIETVYPPTTVAATTALLSAKYPLETAWIGWTQYFREIGAYVQMFSGNIEGTSTPASVKPSDIARNVGITELINRRAGLQICDSIMGFDCLGPHGQPSTGVFFDRIEKAIKKPENGFVYCYWPEPDHSLHGFGLDSKETTLAIKAIDQSLVLLCKRNPDVVFLFLADHGHTPIKWVDIRDYPDFSKSLLEPRFSIEPRFATFFVRPDMHKAFEDAYAAHFASDFEIYPKERIYGENVLGYGQINPLTDQFLGDYTLIATKDKAFCDGFNFTGMVSNHAGATKEERIVELGLANA